MAKETLASKQAALAKSRADLHRACKSDDAKKVAAALTKADSAFEVYKEAVDARKAALDKQIEQL